MKNCQEGRKAHRLSKSQEGHNAEEAKGIITTGIVTLAWEQRG